MEEIEIPVEKIQEDIHHVLHNGGFDKFVGRGALLSAFLAGLAAVCALFAGHYSNEAMILQIQASDQWSYYQAKGIKSSVMEFRSELLKDEKSQEKIKEYKIEQEEIKTKAQEKEKESSYLLHKHEGLATSVTFFQVAIALTAIAVLTKRKYFMWVSGAFGSLGLIWMLKSFLLI